MSPFVEGGQKCAHKVSWSDILDGAFRGFAVSDQDVSMRAANSAGRARSLDRVLLGEEVPALHIVNTCFGLGQVVQGERPVPVTPVGSPNLRGLSVRAINVLKILADEIMGEV